MAINATRRVHRHKKGESRSAMQRYKKRIKAMEPKQFFKELHDVNDECLGGSAKMRLLITHLTAKWKDGLTKRRVGVKVLRQLQDSVANMSDGFARQGMLLIAKLPPQASGSGRQNSDGSESD